MATTIRLEPQEFQSAYNEIITVLDSNKKSRPKFKHVVEIWIDGVYSSKLKVAPNPDGFGVVNLSKHIESYLTSDLDLADVDVFKNIPNSFVKYEIVLKEEYVYDVPFLTVSNNGGFAQYNFSTDHYMELGDFMTVNASLEASYIGEQEITNVVDSSTVVTTKPYVATSVGNAELTSGATTILDDPAVFSEDKYALNNVVDWVDVPNFDPSVYEVESTTPALFLTNLSQNQTVFLDDRINFNFYNKTTNEAYYLEVDSTLGVIRIENNLKTTSDANKFLSVGVAPADILNHSGSTVTLVSGVNPNIDDTIEEYSVVLTDSAGNPTSERFYFKIKSECSPYTNYKLIYLNRSGSFSDFNFELGSNKNVNVKRTNYNKNYGNVTQNGEVITYGWNSYDRGVSSLDTDVTDTYTINSNYITETEGEKIGDLLESPEVYHLENDGTLRAINIKTSSVKIKTRLIDQLVNYSIQFNYSNKNTTQR